MVDRMISPFTLTAGPALFILALVLLSSYTSWSEYVVAVAIYFLWVLFSRTCRMMPHFWRIPGAAPSLACGVEQSDTRRFAKPSSMWHRKPFMHDCLPLHFVHRPLGPCPTSLRLAQCTCGAKA